MYIYPFYSNRRDETKSKKTMSEEKKDRVPCGFHSRIEFSPANKKYTRIEFSPANKKKRREHVLQKLCPVSRLFSTECVLY